MLANEPIGLIHRLHFKIALFVISTIVIIFSLFTVYQLSSYEQKLTAMQTESSELLCETLTSSLEIAMLNSDIQAIQYSFEEISRHSSIGKVFLLNNAGVVRASSQRGMIGSSLGRQDQGCRECHSTGIGAPRSTTLTLDAIPVLRTVTPIENKPLCHTCHGDTTRWNGILILDQSLQPIRAEIVSNVQLAGIVAAASVLAMMFLFRWYIKRQVIVRVEYLESLARQVTANSLDLNIELAGRDELASLAASLNNMKESLNLSLRTVENHRNYLNHLLDNLIDGILIIGDNGTVAFVNQSFARVLGLSDDSVRHGDVLDFYRPPLKHFQQIGDLIAATQRTHADAKEIVQVRIIGGAEKYLEVHTGILELPPKRRTEIMVVIRDITSRITSENQVNQSEKLATVGRLAAGIAHEINNPMASILTCAEGLLKRESSGGGTHEYLNIIKNSAQRCKVITQKLLDYSASPHLTKERVSLHDVLRESVALLRFEAERKAVRIDLRVPANVPPVVGSKDSFVQVFVNLVLNGIQAVEPGGEIRIILGHNGKSVDVCVNDNGPGISEADRARVFDPFFTTKPIGMGTGLGLSVSHGLVKRHGGTIDIVESREGFTSIRVQLPVAPETE